MNHDRKKQRPRKRHNPATVTTYLGPRASALLALIEAQLHIDSLCAITTGLELLYVAMRSKKCHPENDRPKRPDPRLALQPLKLLSRYPSVSASRGGFSGNSAPAPNHKT